MLQLNLKNSANFKFPRLSKTPFYDCITRSVPLNEDMLNSCKA